MLLGNGQYYSLLVVFSLSLLGTFLVRSGVLTSVHAFATDPARGLFILIFLFVVIGGSLGLYSWRFNLLQKSNRFALFSRETGPFNKQRFVGNSNAKCSFGYSLSVNT